MAVYYATKAYVLSFSEALNHELKSQGVRVIALCPGPVPTEFQARAGIPEVELPNGQRAPRALGSNSLLRTADQVASAGYAGLMRGQRVVIPGIGNKAVALLARLTPHRVMLEIIARSQAQRKDAADGAPNKAVREAP
jgi:uncharacterized protein